MLPYEICMYLDMYWSLLSLSTRKTSITTKVVYTVFYSINSTKNKQFHKYN